MSTDINHEHHTPDDEPRKRWRSQPTISLKLPRCDNCGRAKFLRIDGTKENSEEGKLQHAVCRKCGQGQWLRWD